MGLLVLNLTYNVVFVRGAPYLPLLFNIVVEAFPILVNQFQDKGWLEGIRIRKMDNRITILWYVYDMILFLHSSDEFASKLLICLTIFFLIFGL